ncbi:MAG: MFS transporter [Pirellulales bacterium]|nr:MFS transporter [Pirellulales bacterium]
MALFAALLGWLFDGFEMGMFPLVGSKALEDLLAADGVNPAAASKWFAVIMAMFLIGAATGGVVFGWLGDRIGRVRAMSLSIFTYAVFTGLCGFATQAWHIAALRFVASLGMGGEWALGVALVTELWSDRSRAFLAGLIGAAANVGYLLVGVISLGLLSVVTGLGNMLLAMGLPQHVVEALLHNEGWRLMMIIGAIPALLVFFVRLFVPESHKWEAERDKGATSHWATRDLLGVLVGAAGAALVVLLWSPAFESLVRAEGGSGGQVGAAAAGGGLWAMVVRGVGSVLGLATALVGYLFPVMKYLGRAERAGELDSGDRGRCLGRLLLGASLAGVALLGTWGSLQWAPSWAIELSKLLPADGGPYYAKEYTQICVAIGASIGALLAALCGDWLGRRTTYALLCIGSFASLVFMYLANDIFGAKFLVSAFAAGGITAAFYGWFPLYLPELFPTSIRATSQGFAFNFGRVIAAAGTLQTAALMTIFAHGVDEAEVKLKAFPKSAALLASIYLVGLFIVWLGPETIGKPLPERMRDV